MAVSTKIQDPKVDSSMADFFCSNQNIINIARKQFGLSQNSYRYL